MAGGGYHSTFVSARCNCDLGLGIQLPPPRVRVGISDGLPQPRPAPGRAVLVAFDTVQRLLGRVEDKLWRVVAEEALAHVDDGLLGTCSSRLIDDSPAISTG